MIPLLEGQLDFVVTGVWLDAQLQVEHRNAILIAVGGREQLDLGKINLDDAASGLTVGNAEGCKITADDLGRPVQIGNGRQFEDCASGSLRGGIIRR